VGKNGLTAGVAMALDEALTAHEIVKVRPHARVPAARTAAWRPGARAR
jgi:RNA-binding protein YhbY